MVLKGVLFPIQWPKAAEAYLTHYVTLDIAGQVIAIGEAGEVCQVGPSAWHALVATWGTNPRTRRIDPAVFARAHYVADRISQTRILGELHHAIAAGHAASDQHFAELGDVIAGKVQGRMSSKDITFADLTGTGVQDTAIAIHALEACRPD